MFIVYHQNAFYIKSMLSDKLDVVVLPEIPYIFYKWRFFGYRQERHERCVVALVQYKCSQAPSCRYYANELPIC